MGVGTRMVGASAVGVKADGRERLLRARAGMTSTGGSGRGDTGADQACPPPLPEKDSDEDEAEEEEEEAEPTLLLALKPLCSSTEMGLELRKSASSILSGGSSATPAVVATAELLMRAAISCGMDKMDGAASQRQGQCGTPRAAAKPARRLQSYAGSRICPHKLLRSMRTRGGQPPTAPLATIHTDSIKGTFDC